MYNAHARWGEQIVYVVLILFFCAFTKFFFWLGVGIILFIVLAYIFKDLWENLYED